MSAGAARGRTLRVGDALQALRALGITHPAAAELRWACAPSVRDGASVAAAKLRAHVPPFRLLGIGAFELADAPDEGYTSSIPMRVRPYGRISALVAPEAGLSGTKARAGILRTVAFSWSAVGVSKTLDAAVGQ